VVRVGGRCVRCLGWGGGGWLDELGAEVAAAVVVV